MRVTNLSQPRIQLPMPLQSFSTSLPLLLVLSSGVESVDSVCRSAMQPLLNKLSTRLMLLMSFLLVVVDCPCFSCRRYGVCVSLRLFLGLFASRFPACFAMFCD